MKKYLIGLIVVCVAIIGVFAARGRSAATPSAAAASHMKIGLVLPLTGNAAFLGESAKKAAELAVKDAGQTRYSYDLLLEDDAFDPVKSVSAAKKLIDISAADVVVSFGSGTGDAVAPIAETEKVPHISLASDPTAAVGSYNYIDWTPPFREGQLLASEILRRGYKRVSIIDTNHPGTLAVTGAVKAALAGRPVQIVSYDLTNVGDTDFRTIGAKIERIKPDLVILEMFSPEIELAARQFKAIGVAAPLTSVETFEWSDQPGLFEGDWFVSDAVVPQSFAQEYAAAYGAGPKPGASYIYDLVSLLIQMQEASNDSLGRSGIQRELSTMGAYDSKLFGRVAIDTDGFFLTDASVKVIKAGKAVYAR